MGEDTVHFKNDLGVEEIGIGVREFKCIGASAPDDHPHIYLDMGEAAFIHCPYCNTRYVHRPHLARHETEPPGNLLADVGASFGDLPQPRPGAIRR